ncbi:MAG: hypothetical protein HY725_09595 [Candidatus Rokubacteria bacterium]|nr:hypothetical protein [Candidatus Rokubacteria bacterium]
MASVLIVGSGASAVHFALSVLKKGHEVTMLDVGHPKPAALNPDDSVNDLKARLSDPVRYFLGERYEGVVYPGSKGEYYGIPPTKHYVFSPPTAFHVEATGFEPLSSFGQGGLAEAWTGGAYPFNDHDLAAFPFRYRDLEPYYGEVARRIGITGANDDLARFLPLHAHLLEPLALDPHSLRLLADYERQRRDLNRALGCYLGRSRTAALTRDTDDRKACTYRGRCLWGCPLDALYTPSLTLKECQRYPGFRYLPNMYVSHFTLAGSRRVGGVVAEDLARTALRELHADTYVLAAGTLSSSQIFMESFLKATGKTLTLPGLMDNRQILIPFVNLRMLGQTYPPESYQYHQLALGIEPPRPEEYVHGLITTLKAAMVHPIIHSLPLDLRTSLFVFRNLRAGLGIVNVNLYDRQRPENHLTLRPGPGSGRSTLVIHYTPAAGERIAISRAIRTVKKLLRRLGCLVPPGMIHVRPMGASVHYAGTIPMSTTAAPRTVSKDCRSHDLDNLYIVDGATFPFLPAKNITFTLMANAVRVAETAF